MYAMSEDDPEFEEVVGGNGDFFGSVNVDGWKLHDSSVL